MLDDKPELEPWSQTLWFVIRDPKGVTSGRLRAKLEWKPVVAVHDDSLLDAMLAETAAGRRVLEARRKEKLKEMWKKVDEDKSGALDVADFAAVKTQWAGYAIGKPQFTREVLEVTYKRVEDLWKARGCPPRGSRGSGFTVHGTGRAESRSARPMEALR